MKRYHHLTQEQRYLIYSEKKTGKTHKEIAHEIGVDESTISRELRRNAGLKGYRPKQAHMKAQERKKHHLRKRIPDYLWRTVERMLRGDWSPEQIAEYLKRDKRRKSLSHESIYRYIYEDKRCGGDLHTHLRGQKAYRKRNGSNDRRGKIPGRVSISERPLVVEFRCRYGDFEIDTIHFKGHKGAIVSIVERRSRLTLLKEIPRNTAENVEKAVVELLEQYGRTVHTVTSDNGREFANHAAISDTLNVQFFFCDAYASWQRGTNENTNGLVRQYFPKSRSYESVSPEEIQHAVHRLNNRPRKCLGFKSPNEVLFGIKPEVALGS